MKRIAILGGSGFIGSAVARQLVEHGHNILVPTRVLERARHLNVLPTADVRIANIRDPEQLHALLADCDAVVNLVGILHPESRGGFDGAHVDLPRSIAQACVALHIPRLIHMSALNADVNGPSEYLRSRGRGENAVREVLKDSAVGLTILRPSVVFGRGDNFINMLAGLVRKFPVIPLGSATARFQPVYVEDVARTIVRCLEDPSLTGQTLSLAGPKVYTLRELVDFVIATLEVRRLVLELPRPLAMLQALSFEYPPGKWLGAALGVALTRDNVHSMSLPNTTDDPFPPALGFQPAALEPIARAYLRGDSLRSHYPTLRDQAGR